MVERHPFGLGTALVAMLFMTACEEHPKKSVQGAPEYLHEALSGNTTAQAQLADCLAAPTGCFGTPPDAALSCAWRGVRLASETPDLSLGDAEAYKRACMGKDESFRQRAAIAQDNFTRRIYDRPAPDSSTAPPTSGLLYPSMETVRLRINAARGAGAAARLPPFGRPRPLSEQGRISWKTCSPSVCLEGSSPRFGGGLYAYRVMVSGPQGDAQVQAAHLAAAGLEADAIAGSLASLAQSALPGAMPAGPICWAAGQTPEGSAFVAAAPGPCG